MFNVYVFLLCNRQHVFFSENALPWFGTGVSCDPWATTMRWWKLWSIWPIWRPWWCWNRWSVSLRFLAPNKKCSFVPKRFRCTAVGRVCYEATKLHSLRRTFRVNWSLLTFDFLEAFRGHEQYLQSQQAPYPLDESRVPRSSQRDGWMWMDGRCRCGIQSSSVQWFEIISHIKKWLGLESGLQDFSMAGRLLCEKCALRLWMNDDNVQTLRESQAVLVGDSF